MQRVAILHYAAPPGVGGAEITIAYHARWLARLGYAVRVLAGSGASFADNVDVTIEPLLGSTHPDVLQVKRDLDAGQVTGAFEALQNRIADCLRGALAGYQACIAHNIPTLNKNLAFTAALKQVSDELGVRVIAWCHDLAWTNAQYLPELHDGWPWDLLRQPWPGARCVTVSEPRRDELAALIGLDPEQIAVVTPGVDLAEFLGWTPAMTEIVERLGLADAEGIFLLPARITRRKNIQLALRILAEVRSQSGRDFRLVVTGPPGPHNPANPGYLGELLELRDSLGITESAHFLYALGRADEPFMLDEATVANLYLFSDALLFPSTQEGFGIPVLEAGLAGIPVFCADLPPLRQSGGADARYFDPENDRPGVIGASILEELDASRTFRLKRRVRREYRWEAIIRNRLVPLLEEA
jgi:glycosyltransferase involved in cell wall biosynthesis